MRLNKKTLILPILIFVLLATIVYAKSFADVLGESLARINDFFKNENYKPYSWVIDFFVFFAVFLAIYMRGIKFAFKEVNKTEKALAVVLALTTAFLMILGGYSIVKMLPFLQYFLFFLLFALIWWLLKDMKSKWARFFLALLLTLLLLLIYFILFSAMSYRISCPEKALPWLPWLLALLLFIMFWILLKDIKNAFGRFLLALLLTVTVVLLILFLLNTFSKELGCPEGPFATSLIGDVGDSFKRMDFGTGFGGFGGGGPSLAPLQQVQPPEKPAVQGSKVAEIFEVYPKDFTNQEAFDKVLKERGGKGTAEIGGKKYFLSKDGKLTVNGQEVPEKEHQKVLEEKDKAKPAGAPGAPGATPPTGGSSLPWGLIIGLLPLLLLLSKKVRGGLGGLFGKLRRRGGAGTGPTAQPLSRSHYLMIQLAKIIKGNRDVMATIDEIQRAKNNKVKSEENKEKILEDLQKASPANLGTDEGRKLIEKETAILPDIIAAEEGIRDRLKLLLEAENELLKYARPLERFDPEQTLRLKGIIRPEPMPTVLESMGIIHLISVYNHEESGDEAKLRELEGLLKEGKIGELMQGKFKIVEADWGKVVKFNEHENKVVELLKKKVKEQDGVLRELIDVLSRAKAAKPMATKKEEPPEMPKAA
ncbi:hypothetical protein HYX07_02285 [Candidatus Woesearchaeota archaeon]|nr:hypothetical protein [Candidatus Woesearchaeota archaeon]